MSKELQELTKLAGVKIYESIGAPQREPTPVEDWEEDLIDPSTGEYYDDELEESTSSQEENLRELISLYTEELELRGLYGSIGDREIRAILSLINQGEYDIAAEEFLSHYSDQDGGEGNVDDMYQDIVAAFEEINAGVTEDRDLQNGYDQGHMVDGNDYGFDNTESTTDDRTSNPKLVNVVSESWQDDDGDGECDYCGSSMDTDGTCSDPDCWTNDKRQTDTDDLYEGETPTSTYIDYIASVLADAPQTRNKGEFQRETLAKQLFNKIKSNGAIDDVFGMFINQMGKIQLTHDENKFKHLISNLSESITTNVKKGDRVQVSNAKKYDALAAATVIGTVVDVNRNGVIVRVGSGSMTVEPQDVSIVSVETSLHESLKTKYKTFLKEYAEVKSVKKYEIYDVKVVGRFAPTYTRGFTNVHVLADSAEKAVAIANKYSDLILQYFKKKQYANGMPALRQSDTQIKVSNAATPSVVKQRDEVLTAKGRFRPIDISLHEYKE